MNRTLAWDIVAVCSPVAAGLAVIAAGSILQSTELGTSLGRGSCNAAVIPGLILLVLAGALAHLQTIARDMALSESSLLVADWRRLFLALPLPLIFVIASGPGILGCSSAARVERVGVVGGALVGAPGLVVAGGSSLLLGVALMSLVRVLVGAAPAADHHEQATSRVDQLIAQAESGDGSGESFHGVE